MRKFVLAEIKPCPQGWDSDQCYDDGQINPCGDARTQHCLRTGDCIEYVFTPLSGPERTEELLDVIDCPCTLGGWTERLQGGDPDTGAGVSVYACALCRGLKAMAISAGWGTCVAVPR